MSPTPEYNFAYRQEQRKWSLTSPLGGLIVTTLVIGSMLFLTGLWRMHLLQTESSALSGSLHQAESTLKSHPASSRVTTISKMQASAVNTAVHQLNVPWRDILDAIELATPRHIALLGIEPDSSRQLVRITGETLSTDAMLAYLDQLNQSTFFSAASMSQHFTDEQDPQKPLRFTMEAYYQAPTMEPSP